MDTTKTNKTNARRGGWSLAVWTVAVLLWLAPWVAMRFTKEVAWTPLDFTVFGIMLVVPCGMYELTTRLTGNGHYRGGVAVALLATFLLVWANLAVGFIGDEGNPANLMFGGLFFIGVLGAVIAGFKAAGMARTMIIVAAAQGAIAVVAQINGYSVVLPTVIFVALWLASAWLFGRAARSERPAAD